MTAMYDTAKQFNRILYWDDDNRLTKTVDTTSGASVPTQYHYDAKGMRIVKEGPYGKSIYIDTGYVESGAPQTPTTIVSNHIFVGNTRVASVVKHTEEKNPAAYFYASDHLGSSSVLTTQQGSYHERIEYLPYGETWVEDKATSDSYTTPYKFTGKELDAETGLYYFGARYYDARLSRWISADPALQEGKYFPKPNDYDTEHDFYWYILNDASGKLPGMGGVYNSHNLDVYCYSLNNPVKYYDPDGNVIKVGGYILPYKKATEGKEGVKVRVSRGYQEGHSGVDSYPKVERSKRSNYPQVAVAKGEVIFSGEKEGYGNTVDILHGTDEQGNQVVTRYAHLSKIEVKVGDKVDKDQIIGYMGKTGNSDGEHSHYEIRVNNEAIDPKNRDVEKMLSGERRNNTSGIFQKIIQFIKGG